MSTTRFAGFVALAAGASLAVIAALLFHNPLPAMRPSEAAALEGEKDDPHGREYFEWQRLHDLGTGLVPDHIRDFELSFASGLPKRADTYTGLQKTDGLASVQATTWNQWGPTNVGGRTRALGVDVFNTSVLIAGAVSGGIWRSTNSGTSWTEVTQTTQLLSTSCLAQDTRASRAGTWYVGTGEIYGNSAAGGAASFRGDGILKSTDNGLSWSTLSSTSTGTPQSFDQPFDYVMDVAVDPSQTSADVVYAACPGVIERSTDGGATWGRTFGTFGGSLLWTDVQVDPNGIVYAAGSSTGLHGIFRSPDGITWTNITPASFPSAYGRIVIGISPSSPSNVYFLVQGTNGTNGTDQINGHQFWKYTYLTGDGSGSGGTWVNRGVNLPNEAGLSGNAVFDTQGGYDMLVKVKPDDPNFVIVGSTNLYRSTDGFAATTNWRRIGGYASPSTYSLYSNHHCDLHSGMFVPGSTIAYVSGDDGGVQLTTDVTASTVSWSSLDNGYMTSQFYTVAIDRFTSGNNVVMGGLQDNGTWFTNTTTSTTPWIQELTGDGTSCAIANSRSSYYLSFQNGVVYRVLLNTSGSVLDFARVDPTGGTGYLFVAPFVLDPSNTTIMYLAGGSSLWVNSNLTAIPTASVSPSTANDTTSINWKNLVSAGLGPSTISALGASTASPSNRLYYGSADGKVYRLDNANTATASTAPADIWTGKGLPAGAYVSCIAVDPSNGDNAMLIFSNYGVVSIYYTNNGGSTWTAVAGNLEQNSSGSGNGPSVRWGTIIQFNASTIYYVGTSTGLYSTSTLNGVSTVWSQEGASTIGNVVVDMMDARGSDGRVVVATHGRGVFYGTASPTSVSAAGGTPATTSLLQNYPNPFNPSTRIRYSVANEGHVSLQVYDLAGREVATLVNGERLPGEYIVEFAPKRVASGMYVYRLQAGPFSETRKMLFLK